MAQENIEVAGTPSSLFFNSPNHLGVNARDDKTLPAIALLVKKEKKKRIKNKWYVEFLEKGSMQYINPEHLDKAVGRIDGKHKLQATVLLYVLYLTGARPVEVLNLKNKDVSKDGAYLKIQVSGAKNGLPRPIYVQFSKQKYAKIIYDYARQLLPDMFLFWKFRGAHSRMRINKKGEVKFYHEISRPIRWHFIKWFSGILGDEPIVPYHLRHNRFSKLSEKGATLEEMRIMKGAKTYQSITPYIHLSSERGKKMAKNIE